MEDAPQSAPQGPPETVSQPLQAPQAPARPTPTPEPPKPSPAVSEAPRAIPVPPPMEAVSPAPAETPEPQWVAHEPVPRDSVNGDQSGFSAQPDLSDRAAEAEADVAEHERLQLEQLEHTNRVRAQIKADFMDSEQGLQHVQIHEAEKAMRSEGPVDTEARDWIPERKPGPDRPRVV